MPAPENVRGTSALLYHLMVKRDEHIEIIAYDFNMNALSAEQIRKSEEDLHIKVRLISKPKWYVWIFKFHLLFLRLFLKYPYNNYLVLKDGLVDEIKSLQPDGIWIYGEELSRVSRQFPEYKRIHTLPDCESLYYYRMLEERFVIKNHFMFLRCSFMYRKYLNMEEAFENSSLVYYHLVGSQDVAFLKNINPGIQAYFIRHPHYEIADVNRKIQFHNPKLRVLIAGQYNHYMKQDADMLMEQLISLDPEVKLELQQNYTLTFLGRGWDGQVNILKSAGYEVNHILYVPDYIAEIKKYDIQLAPISIGTGTKGKVLDALSNGLLVIGSWYALENIAVDNGISCIQYISVHDVIDVLRDIPQHINHYEQIAENGRSNALICHDRTLASWEMFSLFNES